MKPHQVSFVRNSSDTNPKRDWDALVLLVLGLSRIPIFLISRILWIAFGWFGSLYWITRNRMRTKTALKSIFGKRIRQGTALLVIISIATSYMIIHESMYAGNLHWGVEVGDQFSYLIIAPENPYYEHQYSGLNNSIVVFEIVSLPDIPIYCERNVFLGSIIQQSKASVTFDNGSSLDSSCDSALTTLFSNSLFPIDDWWFINSLYYEHARGGLGAQVQDPWFARIEGNEFRFGESHITCVGAPGWDATISMEDGVPNMMRDYPIDWGAPLVTLTRII